MRSAFTQATTITRDAAMQRRRPDWHLAVQCILRADAVGLARVLTHLGNVNAAISGGTLLQVALMGAFPVGSDDTAALERGLACIRALLDGGADPNLTHSGIPPLAFAIVRGIGPALRLLIKRGATWAPLRIDGRPFHSESDFEWLTLDELMQTARQLSDAVAEVLASYRCEGCRRQLAAHRCGQCMNVRYCCRGCQKSDWPSHRDGCRAAPTPTREPTRHPRS